MCFSGLCKYELWDGSCEFRHYNGVLYPEDAKCMLEEGVEQEAKSSD